MQTAAKTICKKTTFCPGTYLPQYCQRDEKVKKLQHSCNLVNIQDQHKFPASAVLSLYLRNVLVQHVCDVWMPTQVCPRKRWRDIGFLQVRLRQWGFVVVQDSVPCHHLWYKNKEKKAKKYYSRGRRAQCLVSLTWKGWGEQPRRKNIIIPFLMRPPFQSQ